MSESGMKCYKAILTYEIEVPCYGHDEHEALEDAQIRADNFADMLFARNNVDAVEKVSIRLKGEA
jgi:hypothetical protein